MCITFLDQKNKKKVFEDSFLIPKDYLPKQKKVRLQKSKKPRVPSTACSDEFLQKLEEDKEEANKKALEQKRKKDLQEKKKILAEKKKEIEKEMRELQDQIKPRKKQE